MRTLTGLCWLLFWMAVLGAVAWMLRLGEGLAAGHLLDWIVGLLCFVWLIILLKVPWDLYFQAHEVAFELQRAKERNLFLVPGREAYVLQLRRRLAWLAVGAHLFSAAVVGGVASFVGGGVGYYFAVLYIVSTAFRPAVAGYVYLSRKLQTIGEESRYPRDDVAEVQEQLRRQEEMLLRLLREMEESRDALRQETQKRTEETRELRQSVHAISREFETTVSRLTDNQEVIKGIQAFVRLIAQSTSTAG